MRTMIVSFFAAWVLCVGVLGYFVKEAYVEERNLLVERIDAELDRLGSERLIRRLSELQQNREDTDSDTTFNLGTLRIRGANAADTLDAQAKTRFTIDAIGGKAPTTVVTRNGLLKLGQVSDRDYARLLDSLAGVFAVSLHQLDTEESAVGAGTVLVRKNKGMFGLSDSGATGGVAMSAYRYTVLRGITAEIFFSLLILFSLTVAASLAYRNQREYRAQLQQKELLLANLSHELKSPIAAVGIALEALESFGADDRPELRRKYIQMSRAELARLDQLADYSLGVLKTDDGDRLPFTEVNLLESIDRARKDTLARYTLHTDAIQWRTPPPRAAHVRGLPQELRVAVLNLLDNAIKYGGQPPRVILDLQSSPAHWTLVVRDNGRGVAPGEREKIFERFYRVAAAEEGHAVKGQGLGLSLVRQIAELHGGRVWVAEASETGATFTFQLPAA